MQAKFDDLETDSKMKNIRDLYRGIIDFKKGYQPRPNIVKGEKGDLVTDSHSILARWRNHFTQLFNVHGVSDVRQTEIHTAELLVPEPSAFEAVMAIDKLNGHKTPGINLIPAKWIKAGGRTIHCKIHKFIKSVWIRRNCLRSGRSRSLYLSIRWVIKQIIVIIEACHFSQLHTKFYPTSCCQG